MSLVMDVLGARLWFVRGCENVADKLSRSVKQQQEQT